MGHDFWRYPLWMVGLVYVFDYKLQKLRPNFLSLSITAAPQDLIIKTSHVLLQHLVSRPACNKLGIS